MPGPALDCPQCHAPVPEGARTCESCGADLNVGGTPAETQAATSEPMEIPSNAARDETTTRSDDEKREVSAPVEGSATSVLYLCPSCGEFVRTEDASCAACGANLGEEIRPAVPALEAKEPTKAEDLGRCTGCGAALPRDAVSCGECGAVVATSPVTAPEPSVEPTEAQAISKDEELVKLEEQFAQEVAAQRAEYFVAEEHAAPIEPPAPVQEREIPRLPQVPRRRGPATVAVPTSPASWRDYLTIVTGIAVPASAFSASARIPGHEWGQLLVLSILFGTGLSLTVPQAGRLARSPAFLAWIAGTALILLVPVSVLLGSPLDGMAGVAILAAGGGLATVPAWRLPRVSGPFLPWLSGLLLLMVAAVVPIASLTLGGAAVTTALWVVGGALAVGPAILVAYRVRMTSVASRRLLRADDALAKRDLTAAIGLYDEALALARRAGQELESALYGKGAALVAAGRPAEALDLLDSALSTNPRNEVAWVNKGTALTRLGRLQDALKCYNSAIKVNAEYEVAWNNKGNALSRLGRHEWALQCYEQALSLDPSYRTAWVNKGYVLAKLGRFDEAAECADRALRLTAGAAG